MNIGSTVIWREAFTEVKNGKKNVNNSHILIGTIVTIDKYGRRPRKITILITAVRGQGQHLVGRRIDRSRREIRDGEDWLRETQKGAEPPS